MLKHREMLMEPGKRDTKPCPLCASSLWNSVLEKEIQLTLEGYQFELHRSKGIHQGCILSPCLFNLYAEYIMRNAGMEEAQAGIKIARRKINNLRYADDTLMAESEEELKSLLIWVKRIMKKLAWNSTFKKRRLWQLASLLHGRRRKSGSSDRFSFLELQKHCRWWQQSGILKTLSPW